MITTTPLIPVDTSVDHLLNVLYRAYEAHEKYLVTQDMQDLATWVELDREVNRIRAARVEEKLNHG